MPNENEDDFDIEDVLPAPLPSWLKPANLDDLIKAGPPEEMTMKTVPIPPKKKLSAKQRRVLAKRKAVSPCRTRVSIFGKTYPESVESEWTNYEGIGWLYRAESYVFNVKYGRCNVRGTWHEKRAMVTTIQSEIICEEEAKANWVKCSHSGRMEKKDNVFTVYSVDSLTESQVSHEFEDDYFQCDFSKKFFNTNYRVKVMDSEAYKYVCKRYAGPSKGQPFNICGQCNRAYLAEMVQVYPSVTGAPLCKKCHTKLTKVNVIAAHNHKGYPKAVWTPKWVMLHGKKTEVKDVRLFGVEVETELYKPYAVKHKLTRIEFAQEALSTLGKDFVMIKEDGTLTMNGKYDGNNDFDPDGTKDGPNYAGFEIVTGPCDKEVHLAKWPLLEKMPHFKGLRAWDTETCGLHIHVTREALTTLQIGRLLTFVNCPENAKFIRKVAGRDANKYTQYIQKEPSDPLKPPASHHYEAINLLTPTTVEFRIFRGTVRARHIIRDLEFVEAICDYCYPCSRSLKEMRGHVDFVAFVDARRKLYPMLAEWFAFHNIIVLKKAAKPELVKTDRLTIKLEECVEHEMKYHG